MISQRAPQCALLWLAACLVFPVVARADEAPAQQPGASTVAMGVDPAEQIGPPQGVALSGEQLEEVTSRVSADVRCPVCQGLSIRDSPSPTALAMVAEVRELLGRGYNETQVIAYFEGTYGEFVRLEPTKRGFNLIIWIAPIVGFGLGVLFLVWWFRREPLDPDGETRDDDDLAVYREMVRRETSS